mgnify:CR=1 FL=1
MTTITFTYAGRSFSVWADEVPDGWTPAIRENLPNDMTADWDGSELLFDSEDAAILAGRELVEQTLADQAAGAFVPTDDDRPLTITEAAEQCQRGRIPQLLAAQNWPAAIAHAAQAHVALLPWEAARENAASIPAALPAELAAPGEDPS